MSSPLARYCPSILNRIHPGCLACNYPHYPGVHLPNTPKMIRHPAWCPCCFLRPGSPTPGCTLVKKHPARCPYGVEHLEHVHLPSSSARGAYYNAMPKPKQAKAMQDDLTSCPQLVQPPSGSTAHAEPEPKQVRAELDSPAGTAGIQTERCPFYFFGHLCCMMWGAG